MSTNIHCCEKFAGSVINRPVIGVSACLLDKPVDFAAEHEKNNFIMTSLASHFDFYAISPELEAGFAATRRARPPAQDKGVHRVPSKEPSSAMTEQASRYAQTKVKEMGELDGFIFKKDATSCGAFRVAVGGNGQGYRTYETGSLFARAFIARHPLIPIEEEGNLNDADLSENFFERIYACRRWKLIKDPEKNVQGLIEFHARHKLMLMARGSHYYQQLGRMVAGTRLKDLPQRRENYIKQFMAVMAICPERGRHVNVLQHIMGYLKQVLNRADKQELLCLFEAYRQHEKPLLAPVNLLRHHLRLHPQPYISLQHYLDPFPEQLAMR